MRTRSSSNLPVVSPPNPSTFILKESPIDTMADQRTMAELLRAPTEGYAEAIVVPPVLAEQFELKHSLINMMTSDQFFGLEKDNPHDHIRAARRWLEKEPPRSILTWEDLVFKFINEFFPPQEQQITIMKSLIFNNEIAKLTHAVNQQTSDVTTAMTAILKQFQATAPPASVNAVEEICVTFGGAHPYYQCLAAGGNTFPELRDNIQGYVSAAAINYNQGNFVYRPPEQSYQASTQQNHIVPLNELQKVKRMNEANMKAMQTQINNVKNELRNEMKNSIQASMSNQTNELKNMMASFFQMNTASTSGSGSLPSNIIANPKGKLKAITTRSGIVLDGPSVPIPLPFINPGGTNKMLKALLSNKEKLQELANTALNENCSAVILKKLPEKLRDPGKFLIPCGFNKLKCKALVDLGASINLMPLSVWKKLGLPELISTRMTLELANQAICTPAGIARDVFVLVVKFIFPADFVIVDYESDPRVPLILGRPFLRTARALIDVHGEEMILHDSDERLTLNMRHDTSSYSNQPQKESINLINVFNDSNEDFLEDLFSINQPSGNPTFSSHPELTSPEVKDDTFDPDTTYSSSPNQLLEEFADELALITFPPEYDDDLQFDIESDLIEIEYLLHHDPIKDEDSILKDSIDQNNLADLNDNFVDSMPEMFTDEHALDYSSLPLFDEYDDDLFEVESDTENVYDDHFDSKGEKIKESKLLIDELDLPCDFLLPFEYDSFLFEDFSKVDALPSTKNEDKVFNPEDFDHPLYELPFFKEVSRSKMLIPFSSKNEKKVLKPGIHTSGKVHSSLIPEPSHKGYKVFKINQILKSPMKIFLFSCEKDTQILAVLCLHFYPLDQVWGNWVKLSDPKQALRWRHPMLILSF
nr:reverse transcriptase domain-containing protein [Tanacetum cinerariifolium]